LNTLALSGFGDKADETASGATRSSAGELLLSRTLASIERIAALGSVSGLLSGKNTAYCAARRSRFARR
jgi:hypothetical protein